LLRGVRPRRGRGKPYARPERREERGFELDPLEGGYAWCRFCLEAYESSPAWDLEETPGERYKHAAKIQEKVDEHFGGLTEFLALSYYHAGRWAAEYDEHGLPYPGTVRDQPQIWRMAVDCVRDARAIGRETAQAVAAANNKPADND
jgi:hypothetical protein